MAAIGEQTNTQITSVNNMTPLTFDLTNWLRGQTNPADDVVIQPNAVTPTGGADGNWILVPNADPPTRWFCENNMSFLSSQPNTQLYNLFVWEKGGTLYWTMNQPPSKAFLGNPIPETSISTYQLVFKYVVKNNVNVLSVSVNPG